MSFLSQVAKPEAKAPMLTIVGSAGTGKTSLAGLFKNSLFVKLEDVQVFLNHGMTRLNHLYLI